VLCAVQNGTKWRVCCVLCRMGLSGVCVVCCAVQACGSVAACLGVACVLCAVQYKLPDDGRRPKHVGAIFV
jgi:1,4-dihydroxy-2-naphthoate octaprenyltransferase